MNNSSKKSKLKKILIISGITSTLIILALLCYPLIVALFQSDGNATLTEKLQSFDILAPFLFLLLQIIQIVIAFIPGEPFPIVGAVLFGEDMTFMLCLLGCFFGTVIVYYLVQHFGRPLAAQFVPEKYFEKYQGILKGKKLHLLIFIIFLLPGLPKDVLTYLVAFYPTIKPVHFFALTTLGRAPAIAMTIYFGKSLWSGNITSVIVISVAMLLLLAVGVLVKKRIENN